MTIPTLLPIYQFAKVLGLHPLHVMGVAVDIGSGASRVCVEPIQQYSWQDSDGVSREELAQAISEAESDLCRELGYWPLATWTLDERVDLEQPAASWYSSIRDIRGDLFSVKAGQGLVISGGRRSKDLINASRPIAYADNDGDGYAETAEVTVSTSVTDSEEIALYYPDLNGDDEWEIRPLSSVTIAAGVATIRFRREQAVLKTLYDRLDAGVVNGALDANFLDHVAIYRRYHDPNVQVQMVWRGSDCACAGDSSCGSCGLAIQNGCLTVKDHKLGLVTVSPAEWDSSASQFVATQPEVCGRRPDYVRLWYRAGYRDMSLTRPNTTMAPRWQRAVAKLAISKLDRLICSCKGVSDVQSHWSADLRRSAASRGGSSIYKVTNYELENNPFGTTIAAMEVWRDVRRASLGIPASVL